MIPNMTLAAMLNPPTSVTNPPNLHHPGPGTPGYPFTKPQFLQMRQGSSLSDLLSKMQMRGSLYGR